MIDKLRNEVARADQRLTRMLRDAGEEVVAEYGEKAATATADLAQLMLRDLTGEDVDAELREVRAQLNLWTSAAGRRARRAVVLAIITWLRNDIAPIVAELVKQGVVTLARVGLKELTQ